MTQDEIIEMAIKAELNLYVHDLTEKQYIQVIETFAKLVAEKEREACAKVCGRLADEALGVGDENAVMCFEEAEDLIRKRGQA